VAWTLVRYAPNAPRSGLCGLCQRTLRGQADAPHMLFSCARFTQLRIMWLARVDSAFKARPERQAAACWWLQVRARALVSPSDEGLAAALMATGSPVLCKGELETLRNELTTAFVNTFGAEVARHPDAVDALPPAIRRRQ